jgi:predicted dehydrogenase
MNRRTFLKTTATAAALAGPLGALAEDKPKTLNLAFVGCAHIHMSQFQSILATCENVKVKYIWDHDVARAEKWAKEFSAKSAPGAGDEIFLDPSVAGIIIASETDKHLDIALAAAKAKKPVYIEKPLATNAKDAAAIAAAIEKAGVTFNTGFVQRSSQHYRFVREQIAKGTFGKISDAYAATWHNGSPEGWFDKEYRWMVDLNTAGFGALGDLGTHPLDLLMWLFGDVASVSGKIRTGKYGNCDEAGEATIRFKNGVTGTIAASYVDLTDPVTLKVTGADAEAVVREKHLFFTCPKIEGATGKKMWTKLPRPQQHPLNLFIDVLNGEKDVPLITVREAAERVRVMEAIYQSVRDQKPVTLA